MGAGVVAPRLGRAVAAHLCEGTTRAGRGWVGTRRRWEGRSYDGSADEKRNAGWRGVLLTRSARDAPATCRRACFRACSRIVLSTASRILVRASMANDARARVR